MHKFGPGFRSSKTAASSSVLTGWEADCVGADVGRWVDMALRIYGSCLLIASVYSV